MGKTFQHWISLLSLLFYACTSEGYFSQSKVLWDPRCAAKPEYAHSGTCERAEELFPSYQKL